VTSEKKYRTEHDNWMDVFRAELKEERRRLLEEAGEAAEEAEA